MSSEIIQSIVLGAIQGIAEFLPISSTAHLALVPYFTGWKDPGLSFDVALHFGTLLAVVLYFYKDWILIIKTALFKNFKFQVSNLKIITKFLKLENSDLFQNSKFKIKNLRTQVIGTQPFYSGNFLWLLIVATIPGVLAGYFLEEAAETIFRSPLVIAAALVVGGVFLYLADKFLQHKKDISELTLKDSILIGLLQAVAIIPGVSRAGATMIGGLWRGLDREGAARFSFLLSTPVILGAVIHQLPDFFQGEISLATMLGILSATISGFLAIKYLLKLIHKVGYGVFFWYRLLVAGIIIISLI